MIARDLGRVYVTGADGFIGSHLVDLLLRRGHPVTALCIYNSNGSYGWLDSYAASRPENLRLLLGDVRDPFFVDSTVAGHDTVFHLASLIAIPYSYQAPQSYFETNVGGAMNVAQACTKHGVKRLIHTSTSEVYGTAQFVPIHEAHPLQAQSPYAASKIGADMLVESYYRSFGLPAVTLRPFNTYGPRQSRRAVIPTIVSQLLAGQDTLRLGNLTPTRDFNYVTDTAEAFLAIASCAGSVEGQVFNTGTGREVSIKEVATAIGRAVRREVRFDEDAVRVRPSGSEVERLLSDASKLTRATGWEPTVPFEQGIERVIEWMKTLTGTRGLLDYQR